MHIHIHSLILYAVLYSLSVMCAFTQNARICFSFVSAFCFMGLFLHCEMEGQGRNIWKLQWAWQTFFNWLFYEWININEKLESDKNLCWAGSLVKCIVSVFDKNILFYTVGGLDLKFFFIRISRMDLMVIVLSFGMIAIFEVQHICADGHKFPIIFFIKYIRRMCKRKIELTI